MKTEPVQASTFELRAEGALTISCDIRIRLLTFQLHLSLSVSPDSLPSLRCQLKSSEHCQETLLYFGYGSNMSRKKMERRGDLGCNTATDPPTIEFTSAWTGVLKDWQLCFHHRGCPLADPYFASIRPSEGDKVYGVVYGIPTIAAWESLLRSECVKSPRQLSSYCVVQIFVESFPSSSQGESTKKLVNTLVTAPHKKVPRNLEVYILSSRSYMSWLVSGAKEERVPQEYIDRLENLPVAGEWNSWQNSNVVGIVSLSSDIAVLKRCATPQRVLASEALPRRGATGEDSLPQPSNTRRTLPSR